MPRQEAGIIILQAMQSQWTILEEREGRVPNLHIWKLGLGYYGPWRGDKTLG